MDLTEPQSSVPRTGIDPFSDAFLTDPYADHATMRALGPVFHLDRYGVYAMARHAEVAAALTDWQTYSSARGGGIPEFAKEPPWRPKSILLEADPPLHDRARKIQVRVLSPAAMRNLREPFKAKAVALLDKLIAKRQFDAVPDLAESFPLSVFPDAVGIREDGREQLRPFSTMVFNSFGPQNERFKQSLRDAEKVVAWINEQCKRDSLAPGGFGAGIWTACDAGEITADEAHILVRGQLTAGLDTTVNGLANAMYAFAMNPAEWDRVRADRSLIKPAFDEVLRWESPVQTFFRTTTRDVAVGDLTIPADSKVLLFLGAANRDERKFPEPERFDVTRRPIGHVGFGTGIHACVGQLLARLEAEVMFEALAERVARITLTGPVTRRLNNTLRCIEHLPVELTPV